MTLSDTTKATLDAALAAHIADECDGSLTTGYVLYASHLNAELDSRDATGYYAEYAEGQPFHVGLGLARMMADRFDAIWDDGGDDDL